MCISYLSLIIISTKNDLHFESANTNNSFLFLEFFLLCKSTAFMKSNFGQSEQECIKDLAYEEIKMFN